MLHLERLLRVVVGGLKVVGALFSPECGSDRPFSPGANYFKFCDVATAFTYGFLSHMYVQVYVTFLVGILNSSEVSCRKLVEQSAIAIT